jgi:hypothetical protein
LNEKNEINTLSIKELGAAVLTCMLVEFGGDVCDTSSLDKVGAVTEHDGVVCVSLSLMESTL